MADTTPNRERDGKEIATRPDQIRRIDQNWYQVKSQSLKYDSWYDVVFNGTRFVCDCPDSHWRAIKCKHIHAVEFSLELRQQVKKDTITVQPVTVNDCQFCGSRNIKKFGLRHNKSGDIQRFICADCKKTFSINIGFEKMQHSPQAITSAMQLYFTGESLRGVQKFLRLQGVQVSHVTIYNWISRYTKLMESYLEKITPNLSNTWRADEVFVKIKGDMKYLFALMDDETRFWIAQEVADTKFKHDARNLLRMGKEIAGKTPKVFITDGLQSYNDAFKKEFWTLKKEGRPVHIKHIHITGSRNNNKMERLNGEIRDREKVVRGLKKKDSVLLKGYQIYHNYVRPHIALNGETPADRVGIKVEGTNKWITLIQNASKL
ncbi:MAG: IS6 family transposase [Candidatus Nitrosotenuis sp.]